MSYSITQGPKSVAHQMPHMHPQAEPVGDNGGKGKNKISGFGLPTASGQYPHAVSLDSSESGGGIKGGYAKGAGQGAN